MKKQKGLKYRKYATKKKRKKITTRIIKNSEVNNLTKEFKTYKL